MVVGWLASELFTKPSDKPRLLSLVSFPGLDLFHHAGFLHKAGNALSPWSPWLRRACSLFQKRTRPKDQSLRWGTKQSRLDEVSLPAQDWAKWTREKLTAPPGNMHLEEGEHNVPEERGCWNVYTTVWTSIVTVGANLCKYVLHCGRGTSLEVQPVALLTQTWLCKDCSPVKDSTWSLCKKCHLFRSYNH